MKKILLNLQFIFRPGYWLMNKEYSEAVDEIIIELIGKYKFTDFDSNYYTAKLGDVAIWIGNHPYASMTLRSAGYLSNFRPSRLTILKAKTALDKEINLNMKHRINEFKKTMT